MGKPKRFICPPPSPTSVPSACCFCPDSHPVVDTHFYCCRSDWKTPTDGGQAAFVSPSRFNGGTAAARGDYCTVLLFSRLDRSGCYSTRRAQNHTHSSLVRYTPTTPASLSLLYVHQRCCVVSDVCLKTRQRKCNTPAQKLRLQVAHKNTCGYRTPVTGVCNLRYQAGFLHKRRNYDMMCRHYDEIRVEDTLY